jgi:uncharacterized protein DUF4230
MAENLPSTIPRRPLFSAWGLLTFFAGLCAVLVVVTLTGLPWLAAKTGLDLTDHVARAFERVLQLTPIVTIKGDSVVLEKSAIAELAVVQRKTQVVMKYETEWLGSSKILVVRGDFIVKAGYDLNQSFRFNIEQPSREVIVDLPKPKILSVALQNYEVMLSSDGLINKLHTEDQAGVIQQMLLKARADAVQSDIRQEAMQQVEQRLKDLLVDNASKVTVIFHDAPPLGASVP